MQNMDLLHQSKGLWDRKEDESEEKFEILLYDDSKAPKLWCSDHFHREMSNCTHMPTTAH